MENKALMTTEGLEWLTPVAPEDLPDQALQTYVTATSQKSKHYEQQLSAGCSESDWALCDNGQWRALRVLEYFMLANAKYYTKMATDGSLVAASKEKGTKALPLDEHLVCLLLVLDRQREKLIPMRSDFRTTKCGAVSPAIMELAIADSSEWLQRSPEHKATASIKPVNFRFVASATIGDPRASRSGNKYRPASCKIKPTSAEDMKFMTKCFENQGNITTTINEVREMSYLTRLKELDDLVAKTAQ